MTDDKHGPHTVHALLADGTTVCIRPVETGDHEPLQGLYEEMSPENLRLRFFGASRRSADMAADRACAPPRPGHRALLAEAQHQVIGLAEYETGEDPGRSEISIAVADGLHHRGVGTLLVEHLVSAARAEGITAFTADALAENHEVLQLFADLGLRTARHFEGPEVRCTIELEEDEAYLSAVEARGRAADVASLEPLLRPDSIAVIGAGRRPGSVGRALLHHLRTGGFTRRLFAVNPSVTSLLGVPSYPSVGALPKVPDLAVLAVPAAAYPPPPRSAARPAYGRSSSCRRGSTALRLRRCWPRAGPTACGSSGPTAWGFPTRIRRSPSTRPSLPIIRVPARRVSPSSPAASVSPCSTAFPGSASASRPSPRSVTSTTSAATTCSSGGRATAVPNSPCCTWSPSATHGRSPARPGA